jgi:microcystin-dependent protein
MSTYQSIIEQAPSDGYLHTAVLQDSMIIRTSQASQGIFIGGTSNFGLNVQGSNVNVTGSLAINGSNVSTTSTGFPSGGIIMWSGSIVSIPSGWLLCDGTNGTPNLQDKFVVGAGSTYAVAGSGGEATHQLTTAEMPSHNHTFTNCSLYIGAGSSAPYPLYGPTNGGQYGGSTNNTGSDSAHNNLPPYYALAFIMKS